MEDRQLSIETIEAKLKGIICDYVDVDPSLVDSNMNLAADVGIDSFALVSMINAIEDEFRVSIPDGALGSFNTLSDMINYISVAVA
ncbi:MAG: acyl carrier protein [Clostridia bacterium]|nr:acyl carrier protein [Clostridia bacterium]